MLFNLFTKTTGTNRIIALYVFLFTSLTLFAQQKPIIHKCGHTMLIDAMEKRSPGYRDDLDRAFEAAENSIAPRNGEILRIPVVFHVIYNTDRQNIADEYIYSQLDVLNQAFRNTHSDTANTREVFKSFAGDAQIEFFLAETDPDGNPTGGITRTHTDKETFGDLSIIIGNINLELLESMKYTGKGGQDAWPTDRYLNIWVADAGITFLGTYLPALLGLATPPRYPSLPENWPDGAVDGIKDGVFLQYQTIGLNNPYKSDLFDLASVARTAVHEVGHYLGLRHISGDEECGNDGIDDTPTMNISSQEANACPGSGVNTCNSTQPDDLPDMWENYMDYSNDICQTLFTKGQVEHMRKVLTLQRDTLLNWPLGVKKDMVENISIYPNPAQTEIFIKNLNPGGALTIHNVLGQVVRRISRLESLRVPVSDLPSGVYALTYQYGNKKYNNRLIIQR